MTRADWEFRKDDQRTAKNADQTEFLAVMYGSCPIDEGVRDERTADAMDDFGSLDSSSAESWAVDDSKIDDAVGATASEIERRADLMGDAYPFAKDGNTLSYRESQTLTYELCLAIASAPTIVARPYKVLPPAFEQLCLNIVATFLGKGSSKYRTGWPPAGAPERTAKFKSVVDKMHNETSEWVWQPAVGMPNDPSHQNLKDLGIDFAVWKRIPDGRRGMLFLLGQCACGDDWTHKFKDLDIRGIEDDWFRFFSVAAPMRLFCIPRHIPNETYFDEVNRKAGLTLDRARIAIIAEAEMNRGSVADGSVKPFEELVRLVVSGFEVAQPKRSRPRRKAVAAPRSRSRARAARPNRP